MSRHRINPKAGWVSPAVLPKGPNGRTQCRYCQAEVPTGRRSFCSDVCVHEWKLRSDPTYVRRQIHRRDRGVCSACGLDTDRFKEAIARLPYGQRLPALLARGFKQHGHLWEADHIQPVADGGGECGLENYRTLCLPCHKLATRQWRHTRASTKET